jgi:hypothetical protein
MLKRIITIVVCIALATALIVTYLYLYNFKNYKNNSAIKAVPTDVSFIMQIEDPQELTNIIKNKIDYNDDLLNFPWYQNFYQSISILDSSAIYNKNIILQLKNKSLTISFHREGKNKLSPMYLFQLNNKAEQNEIIAFIENESTELFNITKRKYNTNTIYTVKDKTYNFELYVAFRNGILIFSRSSLLVENSLRHLNSEFSLLSDQTFSKMYKTAGNSCDINLFVNFHNLPEAIKPLFNNSENEKLQILSKIGHWGEFDLNLNNKNININGFIYPSPKNNNLSMLFAGMNSSSSDIVQTIPSNTTLFMSFHIDKGTKLKQNLKDYLTKNQLIENYNTELNKSLSNLTIEEYEKIVFDIIDEEFALVYTQTHTAKPEEGKYLIIQTNSKSKSLQALARLNNDKKYEPVDHYQLDEKTSFPIYKGENLNAFRYIFSQIIPKTPVSYFSFIDNYLVFSNTISSLKSIIYSNELKKTLNNSKYFQQFTEHFSYRENFFLYCDIAQSSSLFSNMTDFDLFNPSKEQKEALSHFYGIGIQATNANDLLYSNISIAYLPVREKEPRTIWQSGLDSTIFSKPAIVKNHNTNEKEILIQDKSNVLYLIANNGKILWRKRLNSPILSEIFQIDYYRNNKLQYLFNTKDRIYLLDRNGNNVEKYPITLAHEATNGIALFDYDNNRNYRIFVAETDKRTYVFDKTGKTIKGWKAQDTEGIITKPIQYFRIKNKDYIVYADDKRNYILNRRGEDRVTVKSDFISNTNSMFYEFDNSLITTDKNGNAQIINLENGSVKQLSLINREEAHYFTLENINQQAGEELIIVTKDAINVFSSSGKRLFKTKIDGNILPIADIYQFSANNKKIGVYDQENNKIYLINNDGSIYKNFPLKGQSRFSIGFLDTNSSHFNLIVGGDNNFLYNYRVE